MRIAAFPVRTPVRYERSGSRWVVSLPAVEGTYTHGRTLASAPGQPQAAPARVAEGAPPQTWRRRFAAVRKALREAEGLQGKAKTAALVGVCRALVDATANPPVPWRKAKDGSEWRVFNAATKGYDAAERRLELQVSRAVGGHCPGCFLLEHESRPRRRATGSTRASRKPRA